MTAMKHSIAVLGTGRMGTAYARTLLNAGGDVMVWNRSPGRAQGFEKIAPSPHGAIAETDLIISCLRDYAMLHEILDKLPAEGLDGKIFIQTSSGTPADARAMREKVIGLGGRYIDAAILAAPSAIGEAQTLIFYSGDKSAYDECEELVKILGGAPVYMGENAGLAAVIDNALLQIFYAANLGFLQAIAMSRAEGVDLNELRSFGTLIMPLLQDSLDSSVDRVMSGDYIDESDAGGLLEAHLSAIEHLGAFSRQAGLSDSLPETIYALVKSANEKGFEKAELPAVFEAINNP